MKLFKLVEKDYTTYNKSMTWEIGRTNSVPKTVNPQLCSSDVIHCYKNLNLGLLLNPIHANIKNPIILECTGEIVIEDYGKQGVFQLTPIKEIRTPAWVKNNNVRILFAIFCAESVLDLFEKKYPNDDRPRKAIEATKEYLKNPIEKNAAAADAARAAYYAADADAADAADAHAAAANAARAAYYAAAGADAAYAAAAAYADAADANAARAAYYAADAAYAAAAAAAAHAAAYADAADAYNTYKEIDFNVLANRAVDFYKKKVKK